MLTFPTHPDAPPLETLCEISERLGCLKIEKTGIVKFFSQAAKTYSYETADGEITLKAKGFNLLEKLLKDNSREKLLETNLTEMFSSLTEGATVCPASVRVFQKQIKVNPVRGIPALIPKDKSYKMLNFIGPRRQIDVDRWLTFEYKRSQIEPLVQVDPLKVVGQESGDGSTIYDCRSVTTLQRSETPIAAENNYQVRLIPKLLGILPALPFGFDLTCLEEVVKFYALIAK